jgi:hypothetical protein
VVGLVFEFMASHFKESTLLCELFWNTQIIFVNHSHPTVLQSVRSYFSYPVAPLYPITILFASSLPAPLLLFNHCFILCFYEIGILASTWMCRDVICFPTSDLFQLAK